MTPLRLYDHVVLAHRVYGLDHLYSARGVVVELLPTGGVGVEFFDTHNTTIGVEFLQTTDVARP